jgi:uncharacterized membrane protein
MEDGQAVPAHESPDLPAWQSLAARVAALEQQVAVLAEALQTAARTPEPARPHPLLEPEPRATPHAAPPPLPLNVTAPEPVMEAAAPQKSLEDRLGSQLFSIVGIVALIFGAAWALKLAIEEGWLGVTGRVVIGLAAGAGLIVWSEFFRRKGLAAFSYALKAVGTGVLYLSLWAGFQLYHLLPGPVALAAMIVVTAWNAFMALTQDAELLAGYALIGGILTPMLLSTGGDHETFLFTYVAAIDLGVVVLQRYKPWPRLLVPAYLATVGYFIGYYARFFHAGGLNQWNGQSTETAVFSLIFFALFALVSTRLGSPDDAAPEDTIQSVLIPLGNAAFLALALYSVFQDSGRHEKLAWLMCLLAALFLWLMRLQKSKLAAAMQLAAAVVCLTVAIPLKLSGQSLTTAWLVEGFFLFWAGTRFELQARPEGKASSRILWLLSAAGYVLGFGSVLVHWTWDFGILDRQPFLNSNLGSALVAVAVLAGAAWLARPGAESADPAIVIVALSAVDGVALLLTLRAFTASGQSLVPQAAFFNASFATAILGLALLAGTTWAAWRSFQLDSARFHLLGPTAGCDLLLFNLTALFLIEHEIAGLFRNADAELRRSLAISAFLMLYGAILLAIGFWRRSAFVRWQALVLILFTIAKVFLWDISGLSAGYRVASFLALGVLLMGVSFAYQKDWLNLRNAQQEHS